MSLFDKLPIDCINYIDEYRGNDTDADYIKNILNKVIDNDKIEKFFGGFTSAEMVIIKEYVYHSLMLYITEEFHHKIIAEFYDKKAIKKRTKYTPNSKDDDVFCKKFLYFNKSKFDSWTTSFISQPKNIGDEVVYINHFLKHQLMYYTTRIYYGHLGKDFLKDKWEMAMPDVLSPEPTLTQNDKREIKNVYYWYKYNLKFFETHKITIKSHKNTYNKLVKNITKLIDQ
jgi:hypothetical protein